MSRRIRKPVFASRSALPASAACVVANGVRETLTSLFGTTVELRLVEPSIPSPSAWLVILKEAALYRVRGKIADAVVVLRPPDALAMAAALFGERLASAAARELSPIERDLLDRTVNAVAVHLGSVCGAREGRGVGFYGGVNYGGGYYGSGFYGGTWGNNGFAYNRSVYNVNNSIHNTYVNKTYINNHNVYNNSRVSYNGGKGGINAKPTSGQISARQNGRAPTTSQKNQATLAGADRNQLASVNKGKPALSSSQKPFSNQNRPANSAPITSADKSNAAKNYKTYNNGKLNNAPTTQNKPATQNKPTMQAKPATQNKPPSHNKPQGGQMQGQHHPSGQMQGQQRPMNGQGQRPQGQGQKPQGQGQKPQGQGQKPPGNGNVNGNGNNGKPPRG